MAGSPLTGDFRAWERQQPTEWGPLPAEAGGFLNADDPATKARFTTGVYSNTWENRAQSLNVEVVVDSAAAGGYRPPLPVNPDNPTAWISVNAQGRNLGVVTFELKADLCPLAADNFIKLCESGVYRGSLLHRIIPGFCVQGGDYNIRCEEMFEEELFDLNLVEYRKGGRSIFNEVLFPDESTDVKHAGKGVLSMASEQRGENGSQFFVTMGDGAQAHLDKRYQAFGQVLSGIEFLSAVECLGTATGKVMQRVVLEDCGVGGGPASSPISACAAAVVGNSNKRAGNARRGASTAATAPLPSSLRLAASRSAFRTGSRAPQPGSMGTAPSRRTAAVVRRSATAVVKPSVAPSLASRVFTVL